MKVKALIAGVCLVGALAACGTKDDPRPTLAEARDAIAATGTVSGMNLSDCLVAREFSYYVDYDGVDNSLMVKYMNKGNLVITLAVLENRQVLPWKIADRDFLQLNGCTIMDLPEGTPDARTP